jgi:dipeptidyl aminopeptidase/acylaminoacyl peptidase
MVRLKTLRAALFAVVLVAAFGFSAAGQSQQAQDQPLTLERLFPKSGWLTGATPRQTTFAPDGKHAAFLHRGELWLYDATTGSAAPAIAYKDMAEFRKADSDTPQAYQGIRAYAWSPQGDALLFDCEGHVYRCQVADRSITRVTEQRLGAGRPGEAETLQYLPDGSGFLLLRGMDTVYQDVHVGRFDNKSLQSWAPNLPEGGSLVDLQFSPDGRQLALVVRKGRAPWDTNGTVDIASFSDALTAVHKRMRQFPGTAVLEGHVQVYVAPVAALTSGEAITTRVFAQQYTGWADLTSQPNWSPDSRRLVFAHYEQKTAAVRILAVDVEMQPSRPEQDEQRRWRTAAAEQAGPPVAAREVARLSAHGGPNTPALLFPRFLADSKTVVFTDDPSGYLQLHTLDVESGAAKQLTSGQFEIYPVAQSADRRELYVAATREHAARRDLYRVDPATGELTRLTTAAGSYGDVVHSRPNGITNVAVSPDGRTLLTTFESYGWLKELVRIDTATGEQKLLTASHSAEARQLATARVEFFSYKNRHGDNIHGYVIKPKDWQPSDRRPALVYTYGGPLAISKMVMDGSVSPDHLFGVYMAQKHGYVSVVIDPRGSSGYGAAFEKANFGNPGKAAVEDLEDGAAYVVANFGVDAKKLALHGWSFGGFATQLTMYTSDVFAVGIAGAGPTEWQNYNAWYTSTTIGDADRLKEFSLVPLAKNLKGDLLLVHGLEDDNVLAQDTIHVYSALLKAGKVTQVELFVDPSGRHGLGGDVQLLDKYRKYEQYLIQRLGSGTGEGSTPGADPRRQRASDPGLVRVGTDRLAGR